jgi:hydrogenase expression/formation protein HypC
MCLAIPGLVEQVYDADGLKMAKVNFGGIRRAICLEYAKEAQTGSYVLVHVGFAIATVDEEEAMRTYELLESSGELSELQLLGNGKGQNEIR